MKTISILTTRWCCNTALKTQTYNQVCCVDLCFAPLRKTFQQNHFPHKSSTFNLDTHTCVVIVKHGSASCLWGCGRKVHPKVSLLKNHQSSHFAWLLLCNFWLDTRPCREALMPQQVSSLCKLIFFNNKHGCRENGINYEIYEVLEN